MKNKIFKHFQNKAVRMFSLSALGFGAIVAFFAFVKSSQFTQMTGSPAFSLGYNVEQVSTTSYLNAQGTCYEGITQLSDAENYTVKYQMSDAGEFQMSIDIGQSSQDISQQGYEEPNLQRVAKILLDNSTMTTYDANGSVIASGPNEGGDLSAASLSGIIQMSSQDAYDALIAAAQSGGTITSPTGEKLDVQNVASGLIRVSSGNEAYLINTDKRVLQAASIFDADGKVVMERAIDAERDANGAFVLRAIQDISYRTLPNTNCVVVRKMTQEFKNFSLVDYDGKSTMSK